MYRGSLTAMLVMGIFRVAWILTAGMVILAAYIIMSGLILGGAILAGVYEGLTGPLPEMFQEYHDARKEKRALKRALKREGKSSE